VAYPDVMKKQENRYEQYYQEECNVCGDPFPEILEFFDKYEKRHAKILDLGCGQGRDALAVARHGHSVQGVDASKTGIRQMIEEARQEELDIEGVVADITDYEIDGAFDVVILDRVLHMLETTERIKTLKSVIPHVSPGGYFLIVDMPSNKERFRECFTGESSGWETTFDRRGFLFVRRSSAI
jgi:2-polyprenyl-3-methyl-5-hydroxy-6-metoxy-1,4-benzoquinol methylase